MDKLRLGTFTSSVVLAVARRQGLLAAAGLDVEEIGVTSSPAQFAALAAGELDAVVTSPDNVLLYSAGSPNALGRNLELTIYAALDHGLGLSLWAAPGVDVRATRTWTFGVDVPTSGFAFAGFALAERCGARRANLDVVTLGSTPNRARALIAGTCDLSILNAGNELKAEAAGCSRLGTVTAMGPYLGTVLAGVRNQHVAAIRALRTVFLQSLSAIASSENDAWLIALITEVLGLDEGQAAVHLQVWRSPSDGLVATGLVDAPSLQRLLDLRAASRDESVTFDVAKQGPSIVDEGFWSDLGASDVG